MIKKISRTPHFKRDYKAMMKKRCNPADFEGALNALVQENTDLLATKYRDHALVGSWKGYRELHIAGDWLLIYRINEEELELVLTRTGTHDKLF